MDIMAVLLAPSAPANQQRARRQQQTTAGQHGHQPASTEGSQMPPALVSCRKFGPGSKSRRRSFPGPEGAVLSETKSSSLSGVPSALGLNPQSLKPTATATRSWHVAVAVILQKQRHRMDSLTRRRRSREITEDLGKKPDRVLKSEPNALVVPV